MATTLSVFFGRKSDALRFFAIICVLLCSVDPAMSQKVNTRFQRFDTPLCFNSTFRIRSISDTDESYCGVSCIVTPGCGLYQLFRSNKTCFLYSALNISMANPSCSSAAITWIPLPLMPAAVSWVGNNTFQLVGATLYNSTRLLHYCCNSCRADFPLANSSCKSVGYEPANLANPYIFAAFNSVARLDLGCRPIVGAYFNYSAATVYTWSDQTAVASTYWNTGQTLDSSRPQVYYNGTGLNTLSGNSETNGFACSASV